MFTPEQVQRIQHAVEEAESRTSGEIVVYFSDRSGDYRFHPWAAAVAGFLVATILDSALAMKGLWFFSPFQWLEGQVLGAVLGFGIVSLPAVHRRLISHEAARRVRHEALARFVLSGVTGTQHRTGVLVYLSVFERRVEIVADEGIHKICGETYWKAQTDAIAAGIGAGRSVEAVCDAVREMGRRLSEHFPHEKGAKNELADTPQEGRFDKDPD